MNIYECIRQNSRQMGNEAATSLSSLHLQFMPRQLCDLQLDFGLEQLCECVLSRDVIRIDNRRVIEHYVVSGTQISGGVKGIEEIDEVGLIGKWEQQTEKDIRKLID